MMVLTSWKTFFSLVLFVLIVFVTLGFSSCDKSKGMDKDTIDEEESDPPVQHTKGFKNLGPQVFDNTIQSSIFTTDKNGNELLYTVVRGEIAHLVGIDLKTKNVLINSPLEGSDGSWDIKVSTDGILYICTSQGKFYKHSPGSQVVEDLGRPLASETYLWDMAVGQNGEIFGASYPGCRVFRYHPNDGFSDIGKGPLVAGENYVRSVVYHEKSDMIYAGIGSHAHLVELNPRTGEKREFLPEKYKSQEFAYNMTIIEDDANGDKLLIYLTNSYATLVYNLRTKMFEGELGVTSMTVKPAIKSKTHNIAYFTAGTKLYEWNFNELTTRVLTDTRGSLATKWGENNTLYIFNGRKELTEYNIVSGTKKVTTLDVPALPVRLNYTAVGADKKIWTGGYLGGSNAIYDPATGEITSLPGLSQTESMTFLGSNVYFGIYPNSRFYVYNSKRPWDVAGGNPRLIGRVEGQDRPFGTMAIDALNKVYFGTVPSYGKNGGALVEYDITMNRLVSYNNVVNNQSIISLVYSEGLLYGGSSNRGGLGIAPSESEAKMFIWDPVKNVKIKETVPVANAKSISYLAEAPDKKIWGIASGTVFVYDPSSSQVVSTIKLYNFTGTTGVWAPGGIFFHPNGNVYAQDASNLYEIDPKTMQFEILEKSLNHLIMDESGTFYFLKSKDLWQYRP